jgi:hypothetical protein
MDSSGIANVAGKFERRLRRRALAVKIISLISLPFHAVLLFQPREKLPGKCFQPRCG